MLLIQQIKKREEILEQHIKNLSKELLEDNQIREFGYKLRDLYTSNFRHSYFKFFPIITEIGDKDLSGLEYLSNNLEHLKQIVEQDYIKDKQEFNGLLQPLIKLSDHINLEIGRYNHYSKKEQKTNDLESDLEATTKQLNTAKYELNRATQKIKSVQNELITVLSIFAAIVMAFSGSMTVLGGALSGLGEVPLTQSVFFLLLCGFILFNLIFAMMYFIAKITDRNIYARCKTVDCTCTEDRTPKCIGINRIRKRLPYVFWLNIIVIGLLIIIFIRMCCLGMF